MCAGMRTQTQGGAASREAGSGGGHLRSKHSRGGGVILCWLGDVCFCFLCFAACQRKDHKEPPQSTVGARANPKPHKGGITRTRTVRWAFSPFCPRPCEEDSGGGCGGVGRDVRRHYVFAWQAEKGMWCCSRLVG